MRFLHFSSLNPRLLFKAPALLATSLGLAGCLGSNEASVATVPAGADLISFTQANLYPEGVEFDTNSARFLVSSQTTGTIGQVTEDGTYRVFATNDNLVSSIGLQIDAYNNRLLVAVSDPGYNTAKTSAATRGKLAGLASFGSQGQFLNYVDLGKLRPTLSHFANDVAVDFQGNAYVTDSFAPIIYKIDAQGKASVFVEDARLGAPAGQFGLNGIEVHPDGFLLVAKSDDGSLFKVPLSNPGSFTKVGNLQGLEGIDGLQLVDNNTLYAATNAQSKVFRLGTNKNWTEASVTGTFVTPPQFPTTLTRRTADETYVLYSNLNALQAGQTPPVSVFSVAKVKF